MQESEPVSENDIIELTRDGMSLIEIKHETGAPIKVIRRIQEGARNEGYILPHEIGEQSEKLGTVRLTLLAQGGMVPALSGLNWGLANAHVSPNDSYIPIRISHLRLGFFPNHGAIYSSTWDDGRKMRLVAEGTQPLDGKGIYPKQLTSFPEKFVLGFYIRKRIGVPAPKVITSEDLQRYGRTDLEVSFLGENKINVDFSER